jgi:hypothetical protein
MGAFSQTPSQNRRWQRLLRPWPSFEAAFRLAGRELLSVCAVAMLEWRALFAAPRAHDLLRWRRIIWIRATSALASVVSTTCSLAAPPQRAPSCLLVRATRVPRGARAMPASGAGAPGAAHAGASLARIPALRLLAAEGSAGGADGSGRAAHAHALCRPAVADGAAAAAAPAEEACGGCGCGEEEGADDEGGAVVCAFCLERADEGSSAKSVRAPCGACSGTLARVHVDCLRHDLQARPSRAPARAAHT